MVLVGAAVGVLVVFDGWAPAGLAVDEVFAGR